MRITLGNVAMAVVFSVGAGMALAGAVQPANAMAVAGVCIMLLVVAVLAFVGSRRAALALQFLAEIQTEMRALSASVRTDPFRAQVRDQLDRLRVDVSEVRRQNDAGAAMLAGELRSAVQDLDGRVGSHARHLNAVLVESTTIQASAQYKLNEEVRHRVKRLESQYEKDKLAVLGWIGDDRRTRELARRSMLWLKSDIVRELEALHQLRTMLDVVEATPVLDGWAMDPLAVLGLVQLVMERKPARIVELGSGASTLWLALALRKLGQGHLVSFDHLEAFGNRTRRQLALHGVAAQAEVRVVKLVPVDHEGHALPWYDLGDGQGLEAIDLLIVDGPPGSVGPGARFPAMPAFASRLSDGARIVVDDANRADEIDMMRRWCELYPQLQERSPLGSRTRVFSWRP